MVPLKRIRSLCREHWLSKLKIQQYVGIKLGKDIANKIKHSKMETAVTQSEGTAFGLKEEMES